MKYSFVVPIYNVETYLKRCVDTLLHQSYRDFEIILVDDGATDSSGAIADEYARIYPERIRTVHQENTGQGGARNHGIELACGEYVILVDSDDYVSEKLLEVVDDFIKKYHNDILIFDYWIAHDNGEKTVHHLQGTEKYVPVTAKEFVLENVAPWNKVIRRTLFQKTNVRFPSRIFYEDLATMPCLAIYAKQIGRISDPLYYYVQRESSTMHVKNVERMMQIQTATKMVLDYYTEQGKFQEYFQELEYLTLSHVFFSGVERMLEVEFDMAKIRKLQKFTEGYFPHYRDNLYLKQNEKLLSRKERWIVEKRYRSLFLEYKAKSMAKAILRR